MAINNQQWTTVKVIQSQYFYTHLNSLNKLLTDLLWTEDNLFFKKGSNRIGSRMIYDRQ